MAYSFRNKLGPLALAVISIFTLTGIGCSPEEPTLDPDITLVMWGLWEESSTFEPIISSFTENTGVSVEYRKIASVSEYEKRLLEALAENRGPDIFVIHHTWVEGKRGLMSPAPKEIIDRRSLKEEFVDVVSSDVVREGQIYALPVSVDTLALYYNKDILNSAGIANPPKTWQEFAEHVQAITRVNRLGTIQQSGATMGTAANINRASDILQLLFMQSGMPIARSDKKVSLASKKGESALSFYTDFANKSKKVYTWDLQQNYSLDAFTEEETAMMLNYSYQIPTIKAKNPRLRFDIAPAPQIADSKKTNFASYWPYAVSNRSSAPVAAWQFLRHATNSKNALSLSQEQNLPPARRDGVESLKRDPTMGVFAEQALTAATWPRGDMSAIDKVLNNAIDNVVTGTSTITGSLNRAQEQINQIQTESANIPEPQEEAQTQPEPDKALSPF